LEKRNGDFYLVLWQEVPGYDTQTFQDIGVADAQVELHISPARFDGAFTYQPMSWPARSSLIQALPDGTIGLKVGDQPIIVQLLPAGADLVVSSAGIVGDEALSGKPVKLTAVVANQGTAPTPAGTIVSVTFFDVTSGTPRMLTYSAQVQDAIPPGKSITVVSDGEWTPGAPGKHNLDAFVDDLKRIPEVNRDNNHLEFSIVVK
jgi:hypothetical protein